MTLTSICHHDMRTHPRCFLIYVTTKQKADMFNSFHQVIVSQTHKHTLPNESHMHVFMITVLQSSQI